MLYLNFLPLFRQLQIVWFINICRPNLSDLYSFSGNINFRSHAFVQLLFQMYLLFIRQSLPLYRAARHLLPVWCQISLPCLCYSSFLLSCLFSLTSFPLFPPCGLSRRLNSFRTYRVSRTLSFHVDDSQTHWNL